MKAKKAESGGDMGWVSWMVKDEVSESGCLPPLLASFVLRYSSGPFIIASIMVAEVFDWVSRCEINH